jgi:hypothetical protein
MQQATYAELQQELGFFFDYSPPQLSPDSKSPSLCPKLGPPPSFYEKHLDDRLTLKNTVHMPSIATRLSETVDKILHSIEQQKIRLPTYNIYDRFPTRRFCAAHAFKDPIIDANSVARAYRRSTAVHCMTVASTLFLSPRASRWDTALSWTQGLTRGLEDHLALEEDHALSFLYMPGTSPTEVLTVSNIVWDSLDNDIREQLPQVAQRFPVLAVWQIFAISEEAEHIMNDMGRVASLGKFRHGKCLTTGHRTGFTFNVPYAPDATSTLWGVPVASLSENPRVSASSPPLSPPKVGGRALSPTHTLRRTQARVNSDSKPPEFKDLANKRRINTQRMTTAHLTSDENWPNVIVAGRSSSTATCLTTSLLQHVGRIPPLCPQGAPTDFHLYRHGFVQF